MQILVQFLVANLPAALVAEVGGLAAVVVAAISLVMKYVPGAKKRRKWMAPLLAIVLGLVAGFVTVGMDARHVPLALTLGLLIALTAIGGHSTGKNVKQAINKKKAA